MTGAAVALGLPLSGFAARSPYSVGGQPILPLAQRPLAGLMIVSDDYFQVMRIPLAAGRGVRPRRPRGRAGRLHHQRVARAAAVPRRIGARPRPAARPQRRDPQRDRRRHPRREDARPQRAGARRDLLPAAAARPARDCRSSRAPTGDAAALQAVIRSAVLGVDKDQPISFFATMDTNVAQSLGTQRIVASLTSVFAGLALVLSAVGLYSVLAYAVSQRTPEIGIRMALGARRGQVIGLVMTGGLRLVAIGLAIGLAGAVAASRLIQSLLFNVPLIDPLTYGAVIVLFALVGALACLIPSLRASRIDPLLALRGE